MITINDIKEGAKFKTSNGIIWIIDKVEQDEKRGTLVYPSMSHGSKGNYRNTIEDCADFLNEEKSIKL